MRATVDEHRPGAEPEWETLVRIRCETGWSVLEEVHRFLAVYAQGCFTLTAAERITVAAHELLENAVNYGSISAGIVFELRRRRGRFAVSVSNAAVDARITMLQQRVAELQDVDPSEAYLEELRRASSSEVYKPMLGLIRVRNEAAMALEVKVDDRNVEVIASGK